MKKVFLCSLLFLSFTLVYRNVSGEDYTTFQDIEMENKGAKLLENYATSDYDKYYKKLGGKRFWGWKTYIAYENEKCAFTRETLYVIVNDGDTAVEESIKFSKEGSIKKHYGSSGSLELAGNGTAKGFKLGLEEKIDANMSATISSSMEEVYSIKIKVDPQTKLTIAIVGEGKVTNGVGKYYRFFKNVRKGGWEIFLVTTEYYYIEKERLYPLEVEVPDET